MKRVLSILLCLGIIFGATACSNQITGSSSTPAPSATSSSGTSASSSVGSSEPAEIQMADITYWTNSTAEQDDVLVQGFMKANPGVTVSPLYLSTDDIKKNLKVAAASNTLPHMWSNWGGSLGSFYPENGLTYDFTQLAQERGWHEFMTPASFEMCTLAGQLCGIPTRVSSFSFLYYKPIFEAAGWPNPPATFEDFEKMLADIKANNVYPLSFAGKNGWHVMRFIELLIEMYCGPEMHDKMGTLEADWNNEGLTQALTKFKEYVDLGYFPEGFVTAEPNDSRMLLYSGIAAMSIGNNSETSAIIKEGFDLNNFGTFNFPGINGHSRVSTLPNMMQCNKNNTPEELETCINFTLYRNSEEGEKVTTEAGLIYTSTGVRIGQVLKDPIMVGITEQASNYGTFTILDQALPQEIISQWFIVQDSVANGSMKPEEAGAFMDGQIAAYKASL